MVHMTLAELAGRLGGELLGDGGVVVRGLAPVDSAEPDEVTFLANERYRKYVAGSRAAAVIAPADYAGPGKSLIRCADPYFAFRQAMVIFYGFREHPFEGVDARANVAPDAELGAGVRVAAFATVSGGAVVGDGTVIYPGVFIGPGCRIGRECILYPNVVCYDGTILGDRVTIHAGSSIGQDGFGFATHGGEHHKIPQVGRVVLADDVEIGACCTIDRATIGDTVIGAGTKFSNLVAIGHGTRMGKACLMVAQSGIAGSTVVGDYCVFGGQVGVVGHIRIADGVRIAARSGVSNDLAGPAEYWGNPARPRAEARRVAASIGRLPEFRKVLRELVREVADLRRRVAERVGSSGGGGDADG